MMLSVAFGAQPTADAWRGRFPPRADPGAGAVASLSSMSVLSPASA
jgi:hypothetical protein